MRSLIFFGVVLISFLVAGLIFYLFLKNFDYSNKLDSNLILNTGDKFANKIFPQLLDLGKFFLTILIGIFVASITFSEKIVDVNSSPWWSKSLLMFCWILLFLSIVADGVGLVFLTNWYVNETIEHSNRHMSIFRISFICFTIAGIMFGFALTSILASGTISFLHNQFTAKDKKL